MPQQSVHLYAHTRRLIKKFSNPNTFASQDVIERDFKLLVDLFLMIEKNQLLKNKDYFKYKILYYPPSEFDNEYIYIYGYNEKIKERLINSSLNLMDFKSIYYVNLNSIIKNLN